MQFYQITRLSYGEWTEMRNKWLWGNELWHLSAGKKIKADQVDASDFRKKHMYLGIFPGEKIYRTWWLIGYDLVKGWGGTEDDIDIYLELLDIGDLEIVLWCTGKSMDLGLR